MLHEIEVPMLNSSFSFADDLQKTFQLVIDTNRTIMCLEEHNLARVMHVQTNKYVYNISDMSDVLEYFSYLVTSDTFDKLYEILAVFMPRKSSLDEALQLRQKHEWWGVKFGLNV